MSLKQLLSVFERLSTCLLHKIYHGGGYYPVIHKCTRRGAPNDVHLSDYKGFALTNNVLAGISHGTGVKLNLCDKRGPKWFRNRSKPMVNLIVCWDCHVRIQDVPGDSSPGTPSSHKSRFRLRFPSALFNLWWFLPQLTHMDCVSSLHVPRTLMSSLFYSI